MLNAPSITIAQALDAVLAIPAFIPATFCTGYAAAWITNLEAFRRRSLVERIVWSIPLSVALSTICCVLLGKFLSLNAAVAFLLAATALFLCTVIFENSQLRKSGASWTIGWHPLGGRALLLIVLWIALAVLSLIDFQSDHQLFMSITIFDHASRVNWTQSILRTGVPPANPLYFYQQAAPMRYYYFWNVVCAAVARMTHLPVRAVYVASCVWGGFILAALIGLYLKHFLAAGARLRKQFLLAVSLLLVSGFASMLILWRVFFSHGGLPGAPQIWAVEQLNSWYDSLLFVPHHISSMVCCMFAFLLAWKEQEAKSSKITIPLVFMAASFASAFGLSIYVAFCFFVVMIAWALWLIAFQRVHRPVVWLALGGIGACVLLLPYLSELRGGSSGTHTSGSGGGGIFGFSIRETFSPNAILVSSLMRPLVHAHAQAALNTAKAIVLLPGLLIELGLFLLVLIVYMVPAFRGRTRLTAAQKSLAFIAVAALVLTSCLRSNVLTINDFGVRGSLFLQFVTLLFASELIATWRIPQGPTARAGAPSSLPAWLRPLVRIAIVLGVITTIHQAIIFRFTIPIAHAVTMARGATDPIAANLSHNAYVSFLGYRGLNAAIPRGSIVQPNPASPNAFWQLVDQVNIDRQMAIASDQPWCGSELGGDPSGCRRMASAIDSLYAGATAQQARETCRAYNIDYLVARIYDGAWQDKQGWVWTLDPVVSDPEFRALECQSHLRN